jgi:hypothetical protein
MVKLIGGCSSVLLAAMIASATAHGQAPASTPQQITAIGCVTRNGEVDIDRGVRSLNMDPNGLALTTARIIRSGSGRASAVPGSQPDGSDSGTIPQQTIVGGRRTEEPDTVTFELTGDQVKALEKQVGRRVEIVGRVTTTRQAGVDHSVGTAAAPRDAAPVPGVGTREERAGESSAHPSTELPKLEVLSFRGATGACE